MRLPHPLLKTFSILLAGAFLGGAIGCEKKKTAAEMNAVKVTAFRNRQKNEAIKAYTELINKYPDSEHVAEAKERLKSLGPPAASPTPTKTKAK
jgi:hypothetical protein